jgi:hypothetical protein
MNLKSQVYIAMKIKYLFTLIIGCLFCFLIETSGWAQSNTFPADGDVGIGTMSPADGAKLDVVGDIYTSAGLGFYVPNEQWARNVIYRGGSDFTILRNFNRDYSIFQIWAPPGAGNREATLAMVRGDEPDMEYFDLYNNGYDGIEVQHGIRIQKRGTGEYRDFVFDHYDGVTKEPVMILKADRNVGIGTANPAAKLAVDGDIQTKEIIVTEQGSAWPDYVFDPDYDLLDLQHLESFMHTHRHLPGMPSGTEVEKNGQNLGEIQAKLLKQIEELTLYIITQERRIQKLENQR